MLILKSKITRLDSQKARLVNHKLNNGFTLIELIVSIGVFTLLMGFSSIAYLNIQKNSDLANQATQLVSSIRQAQALAISGQTIDNLTNTQVGIHFEEDSYTIFFGPNYDPANVSNITTNLSNQIDISYNLPSANLLFIAQIGEVNNFDPEKNSITITHQDDQFKTININRLGVVNF